MMSIFLLLMLVPDVGRRTRTYTDERWLYAAEQAPGHDEKHEGTADLYEQPSDEAHDAGKANKH
jgi:hypothetical protein